MDTKHVLHVLRDWEQLGMNHGQLMNKHRLTREQEFAITHGSDYLHMKPAAIAARVDSVTEGMKSAEIIATLRGSA